MESIQIGHLLHSSSTRFVAGCSVSQSQLPAFGALVLAPIDSGYHVYGLIYDIHIQDDGLVRQLVTTGDVKPEVMRDNRERRIVPVEMSILAVGFEQSGRISHLLPPRPPLSLDVIQLCKDEELTRFVTSGRFGYFRHILQADDLPIGELLAAHLQKAKQVVKDADWFQSAAHELITLLRDDYPTLMSVLGSLSETY
jgi:hypothetical protein